jgi:hypothetical protein
MGQGVSGENKLVGSISLSYPIVVVQRQERKEKGCLGEERRTIWTHLFFMFIDGIHVGMHAQV